MEKEIVLKSLVKAASSTVLESEERILKSFCRICMGKCGIIARVKDGRLTEVKGLKETPHSKGHLCARGIEIKQLLYHPDRIKYPMKRVGERGEGRWIRISWEEAYKIIVDRFLEIKQKYGAKSIFTCDGTGRDQSFHYVKSAFWKSLGSTVMQGGGNEVCWVGAFTVEMEIIGDGTLWEGGDVPNAKCVIAWGKGSRRSGMPPLGRLIFEAKKRGAKIIAVDPRRTEIASIADIWLPIRPGTDNAMVLAWLNVIIDKELYNQEFVKKWTNGPFLVRDDTGLLLRESDVIVGGNRDRFLVWDTVSGDLKYWDSTSLLWEIPEIDPALFGTFKVTLASGAKVRCRPVFQLLKERVEEYSPERVEEICWVSADKIREAATMFAENSPASCLVRGVRVEFQINTSGYVHAMCILLSICGCYERPGGQLFCPKVGHRPFYRYFSLPPIPDELRLTPGKYKFNFLEISPGWTVFQTVLTGKPYPLKAVFVMQGNPILSVGDSKMVYEALKKLEFIVVADRFMTPTAELADIVLPATTEYEMDGVTESGPSDIAYCVPMLISRQSLVEPLWQSKADPQVLCELAPRLGIAKEQFPLEKFQDMFDWGLEPLGFTFEELKEKGFVTAPVKYQRYETGELRLDGKKGFQTSTGMIHIYSERLGEEGWDSLPTFIEPPISYYSTPELVNEYPLICMSGQRTRYLHSEGRQIPMIRRTRPVPIVEINPKTATELDIKEGDWVWIESPRGKCRMKAQLTDKVHPKMIEADHGWWFPEKTGVEGLHGVFDSNINLLCNNIGPYDPATASYQLSGYLCKVYKADEGPPEGIWTKLEDFES